MQIRNALLAAGALAPFVSAHNGDGIPNIVGINMKDLKGRDMLSNLKSRIAEARHQVSEEVQSLGRRQDDKRCGPQYGSCAQDECCSGSGWCGTGGDYCYSPGCDWKYGPACSENKTPQGTNTSSVARPKNGNVPYGGSGIYSCNKAGTIALTFDDGPVQGYTSHILDLFKSYNAKGTFFVTGANINKGQIDTTPEHADVIKRMHAEGHQIASHTWTHLDLSKISAVERKNQMWKLEMALRNILGFFPTYMRPPYSSCSAESGCEKDMADLGYHISYFDVDTDDYNQLTKENIQKSKDWFKGNITANGAKPSTHDWLGIAHDIHELTAYNLTEYMLKTLTDLGYKAVTMGECLNDPKENWYRGNNAGSPTTTTRPPTSTPTPTGLPISPDARCGATAGTTCLGSTFGSCCSHAGWCGSTPDYCGAGCQSGFGTCTGTGGGGGSKVSTDGTCGGAAGMTCQGSAFGGCCSQYGWCGSTAGHCGTGCQGGFGTCN